MIKELIDAMITELTTLKGPSLVVVFIILAGYALKMIPRFPNKFIPLVSFCIGPLLAPVMVSWPNSGDMPPGVRWPEAAAWAQVIVMGFLLACCAWILHGKVLRKLIDEKIPALTPGRKVEQTKSVETASDAGGAKTITTEEKKTIDVQPSVKTETTP
jgi:hypothetical protein